jgi:hypothetical protein
MARSDFTGCFRREHLSTYAARGSIVMGRVLQDEPGEFADRPDLRARQCAL